MCLSLGGLSCISNTTQTPRRLTTAQGFAGHGQRRVSSLELRAPAEAQTGRQVRNALHIFAYLCILWHSSASCVSLLRRAGCRVFLVLALGSRVHLFTSRPSMGKDGFKMQFFCVFLVFNFFCKGFCGFPFFFGAFGPFMVFRFFWCFWAFWCFFVFFCVFLCFFRSNVESNVAKQSLETNVEKQMQRLQNVPWRQQKSEMQTARAHKTIWGYGRL